MPDINLLVVENEAGSLRGICEQLEQEGCRCEATRPGGGVREALSREVPDVVLMDLLVPGLDAACLTGSIRQRFPEIHVIALTSFGAEKTAQGVLEAGASGSILKNISAAELAEAIRAAHAGQDHPRSLRPRPGAENPRKPCAAYRTAVTLHATRWCRSP